MKSKPSNISLSDVPERFVPLLERTVHLLEKGQSINIIAERGGGKTTFLRHVLNSEFMKRCGVNPKQFLITGVTGEDILGCSIDSFWKELILPGLLESAQALGQDELAKKIEEQIRERSLPIYQKVDEIFYIIKSHPSHLQPILVWDDFDYVESNSEFNRDLFNFLRSLANTYGVTYLIASERNLGNYQTNSTKVSHFMNIFYRMPLT